MLVVKSSWWKSQSALDQSSLIWTKTVGVMGEVALVSIETVLVNIMKTKVGVLAAFSILAFPSPFESLAGILFITVGVSL